MNSEYSGFRRWLGIVALVVLMGLLYTLTLHASRVRAQGGGYSLRFYGNGFDDIDRVKIQVDDPTNSDPGPPADVGASDFTLEFWMKANAVENTAGAVACGANDSWIYGHVVFDRDRFDQDRKFGLSIAGGVFVFGVSGAGTGERTICGTTNVLNGNWHHVSIQRRRSDGWMWLYVDGNLEAQEDGPDGDISYPDDALPSVRQDGYCQGPGGAWGGVCQNDPYLVIGAEKHDAGADDGSGNYPSYSGWIDEVRLSNVLRYSGTFTPPTAPFTPDSNAVALYHLDEGPAGPCTGTVLDSSGASGGPSNGLCRYGGTPAGPVYTADTPFTGATPTPTPTPTPDIIPPLISDEAASALDTSAWITWNTSEPATSQVIYGISPNLTMSTTETTDYVTSHSVTLVGLTPATAYDFQVRSRDGSDNMAASEVDSFTTLASQDVRRIYLPLILKSF